MYIYLTTNIINGKVYIGKSERDTDKSKNYIGSGKIIKRAILKYGKEYFKKEILFETNNPKILSIVERITIREFKEVYQEMCYNIAAGGTGGNSIKYYSPEERNVFIEKMSKLNMGEKNGFYGQHHSEETRRICGIVNLNNKYSVGRVPSNDTRKKIGKGNLGKTRSDEVKQKASDRSIGEGNPMYGKNHTDESLSKMSDSQVEWRKNSILECEHCGKLLEKTNYTRWHGDNCKLNPNITHEQLDKRIPWNKC